MGTTTYTLQLDLPELWTIFKHFRQSRELGGGEIDSAVMLDVVVGITALSKEGTPKDKTAPVQCDRDNLWRMSRMVDQHYSYGGRPTGHSSLLKVFQGIIVFAEGDDMLGSELIRDAEALLQAAQKGDENSA